MASHKSKEFLSQNTCLPSLTLIFFLFLNNASPYVLSFVFHFKKRLEGKQLVKILEFHLSLYFERPHRLDIHRIPLNKSLVQRMSCIYEEKLLFASRPIPILTFRSLQITRLKQQRFQS